MHGIKDWYDNIAIYVHYRAPGSRCYREIRDSDLKVDVYQNKYNGNFTRLVEDQAQLTGEGEYLVAVNNLDSNETKTYSYKAKAQMPPMAVTYA